MTIWVPAPQRDAESLASTRSPPPGAQAPSQAASSRLPPATPASPVPPKQVQPSPGVLRVERPAPSATPVGLDRGTRSRGARSSGCPADAAPRSPAGRCRTWGRAGSSGSRRCRGRRRLRRVGGHQPDALEALARAQRNVLDGSLGRPRGPRRRVGGGVAVGTAQPGGQVGLRPAPRRAAGRGRLSPRAGSIAPGQGKPLRPSAAASWPQAPSISRPRVSRTVVGMPWASQPPDELALVRRVARRSTSSRGSG